MHKKKNYRQATPSKADHKSRQTHSNGHKTICKGTKHLNKLLILSQTTYLCVHVHGWEKRIKERVTIE